MRRRPSRRRSAGAWRCIARIRCARHATRSWTRWGSRWRTSIWSATWREFDSGAPIDSSGQLADGSPLQGPADLRQALLSRSDAFMTTITEKLMTYALGRPLDYCRHADRPGDRSAGRGERQSILVGVARNRRKRPVSEENKESAGSGRTGQDARRLNMAFVTKKHLSRRTFLHGAGVAVALPLLESMVPAATALGQTAARPRTRLGCIYFPHGAIMNEVDAGDRGRRLRALGNPPAAQAVPRSDQRHQRPRPCAGVRKRRDGQPQPVGRLVPERRHRGNRRAAAISASRGSDRRAEDRTGHAPPVARADDRGIEPELRRRTELLVPRHDFVAGPARRRCRCRTIRRSSSSGCSATGTPPSSARRAAQQSLSLLDSVRRRSIVAAAQAAGGRPHPARSVPDRRARNRASRSEGRPATLGRSRRAERADWRAARTSKSTSS